MSEMCISEWGFVRVGFCLMGLCPMGFCPGFVFLYIIHVERFIKSLKLLFHEYSSSII